MATIDSLQDSVNTLTSSTTTLLDEVNVSKATLIDSKDLAEAAASSATTQAANAASSASAASSSASSASSSASAASASAASASAIVTGVATGMPSVRPSLNLDFVNSKTVDPRISFTRSTTATYYDGKTTAKAEENLLTNSESLQDWSIGLACSKAANTTTAPDGTTTADSLIGDGTSTWHGIYRGFTPKSFPFQYSVYAKAGTESYLQMRTNSTPSGYANFDLTNGTVTQTDVMTGTITSVGNGWYRCSVNVTTGTISTIGLDISDSGTIGRAGANTASGNIYLWGAQVEERDSLTAYTPTTASPITNYIPVLQTAAINEPRLDHDPVTGEAKGLLIEESRTNLFNYSENFSASPWAATTYSIITNNMGIAPDGSQTATLFVPEDYPSEQGRYYATGSTNSGTETVSVYLKYAGHQNAMIRTQVNSSWTAGNATFDLVNGTVTPASFVDNATIEPVGNGWYRCSVTWTNRTHQSVQIFTVDAAGSSLCTGNNFDGILVWGAQLEVGSFPTSYIPTSGASVTRAAESGSISSANTQEWVSQGTGTFYAEFSQEGEGGSAYGNVWSLGGIDLGAWDVQGDEIKFLIANGGTYYANITKSNYVAHQTYKTAASYASNDAVLIVDGSIIGSDTSVLVPNEISDFTFGVNNTCLLKKISYYPQRLADSELQALTQS